MPYSNSSKTADLRHQLVDYVAGNKLSVGEQIPSEAALAIEFGVSRNTIRELLVQLEAEGIVVRNHGRGTFLRTIPQRHGTYQSFPSLIANSGRNPSVIVNGPLPCIAGEAVITELAALRRKNVQRIERLILADDLPVVFVIDHLPARIMDLIPDWQDFDGDMVARLGLATGQSQFIQNVSVNALACNAAIAEQLNLSEHAPIIHVHTSMQTVDMTPVAVTDSYIRPNQIPLDYRGTIRVTPPEVTTPEVTTLE